VNYKRELARFEHYLEERVQPGTLRMYIYSLGRWFDYLDGGKPSRETAQQYVDHLAKTKSASTANLRAHAIMRWFKWRGSPVGLDCPTIRLGEIKYLVMPQIEKLLAACTSLLELVLITVLFDTAIRVSELLNLELSDIDTQHMLISVIRKGGTREEVNISEKAFAVLEEWIEARAFKSEKVFGSLAYYDAWLIIKNVGKRVGISMSPHVLRHSRAIQMLMSGAELHTVQQHLGHRNIATTANIYGRFRAVHLREMVPAW